MAVGEIFLAAFLKVLFDKLGTELISAFARQVRIEKLLKRWTKTLSLIQAYISDAEAKQLTETAVKIWLEELRDLAYDLDDVLDEMYTEAQIQEPKGVDRGSGKLRKFITTCKDYSPRAFMFKEKMTSKIKEISVRLEENERIGNGLNLSRNVAESSSHSTERLPSTSIMESHVYGRDEDKEALYRLMMDNRENVSVIPIVGMGGIGKTTLAQLIYNDKKMAGDFDMKYWVCISEKFDVFTATKTIFHLVTGESTESKDLNFLQEKLQATFSNKKFLFILDDVWNKEYLKWEAFVRPFLAGFPGSKVLVTTRDNKIALMVGTCPSYQVSALSDGECQCLLAQHALRRNNFDEHPHLKGTGEELVRKCKGLPLAAKSLGGVLRSKEQDEDWKDVLHNNIWNLSEESNILPVLRLSYHHLPSHLKNLFAYCSIFPKGYEFDKFELVLLWMAEGFLEQPKGRKTKEQLGFECFDELLSRSFFQRSNTNISCFMMHDLVNDLAQFVAGNICYKMDEIVETDDEYKIPEKARHASFLRHEYEVFKKFKGFYRVKGLRTFLPMPFYGRASFNLSNRILFELLPKLHNSRVISLCNYSITELPDSICKLIHLRYLNLSRTSIVSLPDSVKDLYNLETLSICDCRDIRKLPPTIGNLVNLRHLDNFDTHQLNELPVELGGLKSLQTLPRIVLSKVGGLRLQDIRNLELLRGAVNILELQNVSDIGDAREASMRTKEIEELFLMWGRIVDASYDGQLEEKVLDALQPHHEKLRRLEIKFYRGVKFPSWIGDPSFSKVFSVCLTGCSQCTSLPPFGQLPELKHLWIQDMPKIEHISVELFGKDAMGVLFPKLETLQLINLPEWEEWSGFSDEVEMQFPSLHKLTISKCPKLETIRPLSLPVLQELTISVCPKLAVISPLSVPVLRNLKLEKCSMVVLERLRDLGSLYSLKVKSVVGLPHLPRELVQSMTNIEILVCDDCDDLVSMWPNGVVIQHLSRLRQLLVCNCATFVSLVDKQQQLPPNLESLALIECARLTLLPNDLRNLGCMRELIISDCHGITNFPEHAIPPMLKCLEIKVCNGMEFLPSDISTLERLEIGDCLSLRKWSSGNFPTGLKDLEIIRCDELEPVPTEMFPPNISLSLDNLLILHWEKCTSLLRHAHNFSRLTKLYVSHCDSLENFPDQCLPLNLRELIVRCCSNLRSLPIQIQNIPSIKSIFIEECRKLESFPGFEFPPNLSSFKVLYCGELKPLSQWGLHRLTSLREFTIWGEFNELQLLADINHGHLFPSSLVLLMLRGFRKLKSVSRVLDNLTSLRHLYIRDCHSLIDLPSKGKLERLWILCIDDCPLLKQRCLKDKGDYWPKISGIPKVRIDGLVV